MSSKRYVEEFKNEPVTQLTAQGHVNIVSPVEFENQYLNRLQSVY